ncbi:hypothetical protein [Deinococcus ruber]|uniref:Carboxypeptidase regulatory-like domain-containing protein n=1 Tax=Deinococcus ruber TaxID=1848197 RepID=A0A918CNT1_9DEIO|nr:hypothetical protein [Deinococcus ruber]GGR30964.1 hypothetical protein GCM10008957_47130 [Deinococcus ruber]
MNRHAILSSTLLAFSLMLGSCGGAGTPSGSVQPAPPPVPTPGPALSNVITGQVPNLQGQPIQGAEIFADNTLSYNDNVIGYSGADGRYSIEIGTLAATYNVTAQLTLKYDGMDVPVKLTSDNPALVAGGLNGGGVRNFSYAPAVTAANPYGDLGKINVVHGSFQYGVKESDVTLTITPVGQLADGSTGEQRVVKPTHTGDGWIVPNVMYGTYTVTATMNGQPLSVRPILTNGTLAPWQDSYTGGFTWPYWATRPTMYLELGDGE